MTRAKYMRDLNKDMQHIFDSIKSCVVIRGAQQMLKNISRWDLFVLTNNNLSKAMFIQHQNTVVSPVFESLICSVIYGCDNDLLNRTHPCKFSGLTTAFNEKPCCVNGFVLDN